jgi:hypothetical protein
VKRITDDYPGTMFDLELNPIGRDAGVADYDDTVIGVVGHNGGDYATQYWDIMDKVYGDGELDDAGPLVWSFLCIRKKFCKVGGAACSSCQGDQSYVDIASSSARKDAAKHVASQVRMPSA